MRACNAASIKGDERAVSFAVCEIGENDNGEGGHEVATGNGKITFDDPTRIQYTRAAIFRSIM